ncbi:helix-turn-helix domain-containing protein [Clostridium sp. JN-9]|uniref:helix-turn-helix domain-containing protein n=1 Tax=Clostridium sp. JN-9 TaxID=2507159 RepID=UPI000FFDFEF9|nr:helix-turn-helix domain-containing protein [Clostridium sp. JN-9]QAT40733.1 helix-turn-helix domain-containing protein [Clostridium sp. JN-9]
MSNKELCKGKHIIIEDRLIIEYGLDQNYTLKELAERVKKDPTTISKEIRRNRFPVVQYKYVRAIRSSTLLIDLVERT